MDTACLSKLLANKPVMVDATHDATHLVPDGFPIDVVQKSGGHHSKGT